MFRNLKTMRCPACGNYIRKGDSYCINCGKEIESGSIEADAIGRLDKEFYCHKCGNRTFKGQCLRCNPKKSVAWNTLSDTGKEIIVGVILAIVFALFILVPIVKDIRLEAGTSKVNNPTWRFGMIMSRIRRWQMMMCGYKNSMIRLMHFTTSIKDGVL